MSFTQRFSFPCRIGSRGSNTDTDLVAVGDGWVTRLSHNSNSLVVRSGVHDFNVKVIPAINSQPNPRFTMVPAHVRCAAIFDGILFKCASKDNPKGLLVSLDLSGPDPESVLHQETMIKDYIKFYITGEMEIDHEKVTSPISVSTPLISKFVINKFGYHDEYNGKHFIVLETF
jgi:hypothetical protein